MNARNKFLIILGIILVAATVYYLVSTPRSSDLVLIGTVDSNQIIISPQIPGRISKLLVDEGTQVKQGELIAVLDPSELEAEARAAAAMIDSLRSQVSASQATSAATHGSTSSNVVNAQARLQATRAQLLQAEAMLQRTDSDSRRMIELARQGVASDQERVQAESGLKAQSATVQSLKDQVSAADADLNAALANIHQAHAAASTVQSTRGQLANAEA
ncbi:MAG: HlyD family secretion protein, partial [Terriglobales bacterium]